ncbi:CPLD51 protein required for cyt b6 assembly [Tribonema minus]|uniref:CPLD51 protein required for cyt b6 assembly n=1 Tax=Tribonema minus TaxID=303371 RepID=A0A835YMB8_9STRA|nr:CPLD51 protein required for cyt b6 assembly [Tribonema minus]
MKVAAGVVLACTALLQQRVAAFVTPGASRPLSCRRAAVRPMHMVLEGASAEMLQASGQALNALTHFHAANPFAITLADAADPLGASVSYSKSSYYATLGLYLLSFPGLWSVIKRAAKTKYKERVYTVAGPAAAVAAKPVKQVAAEVVAYFQANNYKIVSAGEEIVFEGAVQASRSQGFFLVFCTFLCLGTLSLVLQIQFPDFGTYWYLLTLLSPYAGVYYWNNAQRKDKAQVRLETTDDDTTVEIRITAGEEELDRMAKTMGYQQKGMIRVKGILEE